jgi:PEGA domain
MEATLTLRRRVNGARCATALLIGVLVTPAWADPGAADPSAPAASSTAASGLPSPPGESSASSTEPQAPAVAGAATDISSQLREAQERYDRALKLYDDGSFSAALLEFGRAYELAPTFRILYNLGVVSLELHDYASALSYFERYLADGKTAVPADSRAEVAGKIGVLSTRVGLVTLLVSPRGAQVSVDDRVVGIAPLALPLRLNAGSRKISARAEGYFPDSRIVDLAGGDKVQVALTLITSKVDIGPPSEAAQPSRPIPWLGWAATAALAGGSAVSGFQALAAQKSLEQKQRQLGVTRPELDQASAKTLHWSIAADALAASALAVGSYSLYLVLRTPKPERGSERHAAEPWQIGVAPGGAMLRHSF